MQDEIRANEVRIDEERQNHRKVIGHWKGILGEQTLPNGDVLSAIPHFDEKSGNDIWFVVAQMLENQMWANPRQNSMEATVGTDISLPTLYSFPVIRQIFPENFLNKICLIKPLPANSSGIGQVFYWKYYRTDDGSEITTSDGYSDWANMATETTVPRQINAKMTTENITAVRRMLAAVYSQTAAEDLMGAMQMDIEKENYNYMAEEMLRELEQTGILGIYDGATAGTETWSSAIPTGVTAENHYQTLYHSIIDAERLVTQTYYKRCNYLVGGLGFVDYLRKSNHFTSRPDSKDPAKGITSGVQFEGRLDGHWDIYSTPLMSTNTAFTSFYPLSMTRGGAVYAPYIPMTKMQKTYAGAETRGDGGALINNDQWTLNVRTRDAFKLLLPDMFSKITIS